MVQENGDHLIYLSMGIGQGELQLTTLQMAHAAAIIANEGTYTDPHILKARVPAGKSPHAEFYPRRRVSIDYRYFEPVIEGMSGAVRAGTATHGLYSRYMKCVVKQEHLKTLTEKIIPFSLVLPPGINPKLLLLSILKMQAGEEVLQLLLEDS